jgi:hypothetical protein
MVKISYEIKASETGWNPLYQQSYLGQLGWNKELLERVSESLVSTDKFGNSVLGGELFDSVVDSVEKLGMLYLGREFLTQESSQFTDISQMMVKFHYYHWLYDSIACLDALARILNAEFSLRIPLKELSFNRRLVRLLSSKDEDLCRFLEEQYEWIADLRNMRSAIIHREGRLITGGGQGPSLVMDYSRMFTPHIDLGRVRLPNLLDEFLVKIDTLCSRIISTVPSAQEGNGNDPSPRKSP